MQRKSKRPVPQGFTSVHYIVLALVCLLFVGIFFSATMVPSEESGAGGLMINSIISTGARGAHSLSDRVKNWVAKAHIAPIGTSSGQPGAIPDYAVGFWSPIDVEVASDPIVVLCKLNFKAYSASPHTYPMFKDLVGNSNCKGSNRKREYLSVLMKELKSDQEQGLPSGKVIPPAGFVFHESRVGSTLVANFLASDPYSMVFSESSPLANALLHCGSCDAKKQIQLIRDVVTLMGRSPIHKRLFFKCQSITSTKMELIFEAFPEVPWAFVYRQPVQTMMSHMDPKKGGGSAAPCMRSKRNPPQEVKDTITKSVKEGNAPKEAWCAAHLNMLCNSALRAYEKYGTRVVDTLSGSTVQRGMLVNYDSLPGSLAKVVLPLFNSPPSVSWLAKIDSESKQYSKSRSTNEAFDGDSKDKDDRATENIQLYAKVILGPTFENLNRNAEDGFKRFMPDFYNEVIAGAASLNWASKSLSLLPEIESDKSVKLDSEVEDAPVSAVDGLKGKSLRGTNVISKNEHSTLDPSLLKEFEAWAPFANHHSSKPMEAVDCPMVPPPGYPNAYSMIDIVNNWNPDNTDIPPQHFDSLCHFDVQNKTQLQQAYNYRTAELPFIAYNAPEIDEVVKKWGNIDYLHKRLGSKQYRTETSETNHFMYWRNAGRGFLKTDKGKDWKHPTTIVNEKFEDWMEVAVRGQNKSMEERKHEYFRVSSDSGNRFLFDELPFFQPKKSLYMVDPGQQKGIHCRFGMRSIIAEAHFDGSRNSVVMLGGLRRWILTSPDQCNNMHMLPPKHPSGRHSEVDWSKPDITKFPNFAKVVGNEVILTPGDFLFVPTYWIHYIVSLNVNYQCNTRSGVSPIYNKYIKECGF